MLNVNAGPTQHGLRSSTGMLLQNALPKVWGAPQVLSLSQRREEVKMALESELGSMAFSLQGI